MLLILDGSTEYDEQMWREEGNMFQAHHIGEGGLFEPGFSVSSVTPKNAPRYYPGNLCKI